MPYSTFENIYKELTEEQQLIVYNLAMSLLNLGKTKNTSDMGKRRFGKFAKKATVKFSDDWEMTEQELCDL